MNLYKRLWRYVKPHRTKLGLSMIAMVAFAATEPAMPALMQPMLDGSFIEKDPVYIQWIPIALVGLFFIRGIAMFISQVGIQWVASRVVFDLRNDMFQGYVFGALPDTEKQTKGSLISQFIFNANNVSAASGEVFLILIRDSLTIIGLLAWMFYVDWKLSLIAFAIAPFIALLIRYLSRRQRKLHLEFQRVTAEMSGHIEESISGIRVIKAYNAEKNEASRFRKYSSNVRSFFMKVVITSASSAPIAQLLTVSALAVIVYLASSPEYSHQLSVGEFVSFFGAMAMLITPIKRLTQITTKLQQGLAALQTTLELVDLQPEETKKGRKSLGQISKITFEHVTFTYPGGSLAAIEDVSFSAEKGQLIALVGPSGSGKSSIINLLCRFREAGSGRILFDGKDTAELNLADLRASIALVDQNTHLLTGTVAENTAYGEDASPDPEKIRAALRAAHTDNFLGDPPDLELRIGQGERGLSGGQQQRISLARAILKDSPILLMDEATSGLDNQSEAAILEALEQIRTDKIVIVIAHRLSTVRHADQILVMNQGRIVEQGNYQTLSQSGGLFSSLEKSALTDPTSGLVA